MNDDERIDQRREEGLAEFELALPELRDVITDGLEMAAALAGGDEVAFERRELRGGEGIAEALALSDLLRKDGELASSEAIAQALDARANGHPRTHQHGHLIVEADALRKVTVLA